MKRAPSSQSSWGYRSKTVPLIASFSVKWMMAMSSCLQGWKNANLIFEYRISSLDWRRRVRACVKGLDCYYYEDVPIPFVCPIQTLEHNSKYAANICRNRLPKTPFDSDCHHLCFLSLLTEKHSRASKGHVRKMPKPLPDLQEIKNGYDPSPYFMLPVIVYRKPFSCASSTPTARRSLLLTGGRRRRFLSRAYGWPC